jgi:hypothetical protein
MNKRIPVLGVDFGGVINDGASHPSGDDTAFLSGGFDEAMRTPAMAGAIESLARLNEHFAGRVWIVSKCGPRIQARTEQWLDHVHLFDRTGVNPSQVRFCRQRPEKADHCAELGITHFVDDRADILGHLVGIVDHLFLFGKRGHGLPPSALRVRNWAEAESGILSTCGSGDLGAGQTDEPHPSPTWTTWTT